jgi:flagellar operon protein
MEDMRLKLYTPVTTGLPQLQKAPQAPSAEETGGARGKLSFREALEAQLQKNSKLSFSKHAVNRVVERNLELSEDSLSRLNEGARLAGEKKLEEPLILVDRTAFLVNLKHNKVITTVDANELKGNVFTNIDGTVII